MKTTTYGFMGRHYLQRSKINNLVLITRKKKELDTVVIFASARTEGIEIYNTLALEETIIFGNYQKI